MTDELNCRLEVYKKMPYETEDGSTGYSYQLYKKVWAKILAQGGNQLDGKGSANYSNVSHKIIIREKAVTDINSSYYFKYKSQVFDIKYINHNYKYKDRIEIFCNFREEGV